MISEIRFNGFDRIKEEQDQKMKYIKTLQNKVNTLENSLKIIKNHSKHHTDKNVKLIKENDRLMYIGGV